MIAITGTATATATDRTPPWKNESATKLDSRAVAAPPTFANPYVACRFWPTRAP